MARHKRYEKINGSDLREIEACADKPKAAGQRAMRNLAPSGPHYAAVLELNQQAVRTLNVLNDRPEEYEGPHHAPMSQCQDMSGEDG